MDVTCSIDDGVPFALVVDRCRRAGLQVTAALDAIGVVTGTIDEVRLAELAAVPGVAAVERARSVQLPDPAADVQ